MRVSTVKGSSLSLLNSVKLQQRLPNIVISFELEDDLTDAASFLLLCDELPQYKGNSLCSFLQVALEIVQLLLIGDLEDDLKVLLKQLVASKVLPFDELEEIACDLRPLHHLISADLYQL